MFGIKDVKVDLSNQNQKIKQLQEKLGYVFKDESLLCRALTRQKAIEDRVEGAASQSYQLLEFLGDAILKACVTKVLCEKKNRQFGEGELHDLTQEFIPNEKLSLVARRLKLEEYIIKGKSESELTDKMLADALEAVIGAMSIDSKEWGSACQTFIEKAFNVEFKKVGLPKIEKGVEQFSVIPQLRKTEAVFSESKQPSSFGQIIGLDRGTRRGEPLGEQKASGETLKSLQIVSSRHEVEVAVLVVGEVEREPQADMYELERDRKKIAERQSLSLQDKLIMACEEGNAVEVKSLLEKGARPDLSGKKSIELLGAAVWGMNPEVVNLLIAKMEKLGLPSMSWEECETHNTKHYENVFMFPHFSPNNFKKWHVLLLKMDSSLFLREHHLKEVNKLLHDSNLLWNEFLLSVENHKRVGGFGQDFKPWMKLRKNTRKFHSGVMEEIAGKIKYLSASKVIKH